MSQRFSIDSIHYITGRGQVVTVANEGYEVFKVNTTAWVFYRDRGVQVVITGVEAMRGFNGQVNGPIGLLLRGPNLTEEFAENSNQLTIEKV